jgi:pimeloyl-ACP methyl ester carboxylesterase
MFSRRAPVVVVVALVAALGLGACSGGNGGGDDDRTAPSSTTRAAATGPVTNGLTWRECGLGECATLRVPLAEADPDGEQIGLSLARQRAGNPDQRIGALIVNPGGPGSPGAEFVDDVARLLPEEITDRFDIVGWDPRGTGSSRPVRCGKRLDYLFAVDTAPDDADERAALERAAERIGRRCEKRSGALIRHISSHDTARDLEQIRVALGEPKLNFLGFSYGSYIGALYAELFPDRVRTMVLDGAIDPAVPLEDVSIQQAKGFEMALDAFLADCAGDDDCAYHHDGNPRAALDQLRVRVDRRPLVAGDGREMSATQFDLGLVAPLYAGADGYETLAEALRDADDGDPERMLELFDEYVGRDADGRYAPEWPAFLAISCLDGPELDAATLPALEERAKREAPVFGLSTIGLTLPCSYWPVPPVNADPTPVRAPNSPPLMVVGTTGDPATPVEWAEGLVDELGSGRLVIVEGTAHTSTLDGNPCLDEAVRRYLLEERPPPSGLRCRA